MLNRRYPEVASSNLAGDGPFFFTSFIYLSVDCIKILGLFEGKCATNCI